MQVPRHRSRRVDHDVVGTGDGIDQPNGLSLDSVGLSCTDDAVNLVPPVVGCLFRLGPVGCVDSVFTEQIGEPTMVSRASPTRASADSLYASSSATLMLTNCTSGLVNSVFDAVVKSV